MVAISEGASMLGGQVVEYGQEDAYGHRKLGGIGQIAGEALKQLTGVDIVNQQLAYLMRAGPPDSLDRMVAISYANLAVDQLLQGHSGRMVALQNGQYTTVPVETCTQGRQARGRGRAVRRGGVPAQGAPRRWASRCSSTSPSPVSRPAADRGSDRSGPDLD